MGCVSQRPALEDGPYHFDCEQGAFDVDVTFADGRVTWDDGTNRETDPMRVQDLGGGRHFVQWLEADRTSVTLHVDLARMRAHNSVFPPSGGPPPHHPFDPTPPMVPMNPFRLFGCCRCWPWCRCSG